MDPGHIIYDSEDEQNILKLPNELRRTSKSTKVYKTYYNGSEPFMVIVEPKLVTILCATGCKEGEYIHGRIVHQIPDYIRVFVARNTNNKCNIEHSILVEMSPYKYMYIGIDIRIFETDNQILDFYSNLCGITCYPYAITKNETYLISEDIYINNTYTDKWSYDDPYGYYYAYPINGHKYDSTTVLPSNLKTIYSIPKYTVSDIMDDITDSEIMV